MDHEPKQQPGNNRRAMLKTALAGGSLGALLLPSRWIKPVVDTVIVPAHAATSTAVTTTTAAPTTTVAPEATVAPVTTVAPATTAAPTTTVAPTTTPAPTGTFTASDIRLKRDILKVGRLASGIDLYRFRYIDGDVDYVGAMAQQVLQIVPSAVVEGEDGFLRVDYAAIGFRMVTAAEWERDQADRIAA